MLYDQIEVEAIKLAVKGIEKKGITCEQVLLKSIIYLKEKYEFFQDKSFLEKAMWNIYAYLELGYSSIYYRIMGEMQIYYCRRRENSKQERATEKRKQKDAR
ncbi:MAG: hypothetical protein U0L05_09140 [Schaedlerella sp.]|nr:hypothetical protein [Schaedlerella sp.]